MKYIYKRAALLMAMVLAFLSVGLVGAAWYYPSLTVQPVSESIAVSITPYAWQGSEILPDDVEGEDHATLIETIISGQDDNGNVIGLNNPDSDLSKNVDRRVNFGWLSKDHYGSMDGSWFDNTIDMEGVFSTETLGLSFIIQVVSDTQYYIYTTDVDLGENGAPNVPIGEYIYPIYRTEIVRPAVGEPFNIVESKRGKAESAYYQQLLLPPYDAPSFDITTWEETVLGTASSTQAAIYTFIGDSAVAYPADKETPVYYRLRPTAAGTVTVTGTRLDAPITVLAANGSTVVAQGEVVTAETGNAIVATFTVTANTDYYIRLVGANSIPFAVSST